MTASEGEVTINLHGRPPELDANGYSRWILVDDVAYSVAYSGYEGYSVLDAKGSKAAGPYANTAALQERAAKDIRVRIRKRDQQREKRRLAKEAAGDE